MTKKGTQSSRSSEYNFTSWGLKKEGRGEKVGGNIKERERRERETYLPNIHNEEIKKQIVREGLAVVVHQKTYHLI